MIKQRFIPAAICAVFLFIALSIQAQDTTHIVNYFTSTLDNENIKDPADKDYKTTFSQKDITHYRSLVWNCWKTANESRLKTWPAIADNEMRDSLIWDLPDNRRMLFSVSKKGDRPAAGYPLFINLHGGGCFPDEKGAWTSPENASEWAAAKYLAGKYQDAPSLYFIPRMPDDRRGRWYHRAPMHAFIRAWQLGVLSGDIDPNRTYITGISEGGYGSFRMGIFLADYFAGAGPMAGPVWADQEHIENLRNTAFSIEVGEYDKAYDRVTNGRDWKILLDSASQNNKGQFNHRVEIQPGKGHGIDYFRTTPWLKQFTRNAYPDTLSLVYYSQCDTIYANEPNQPCTYRTGFGYLRLDGLSQTGQRSFYVEKSGNTFTIRSANIKANVTGEIKLYVDKVDFSAPVKIIYNGQLVSNKKIKPDLGTMEESLALFGDPMRIFPGAVRIKIN